jgi:nucleoid DNA-binding protein
MVPSGRKPPHKSGSRPRTPAGTTAKRTHLRAVEPAEIAVPAPEVAPPRQSAPQEGAFRRADLIEAVSERTALKRSDAKIVLDLVLEELGRALDVKDDLALPPLGKLSVKKRKPDADGPGLLTVKIRRPRAGAKDAGGQGESPLADPDEDG